MNDDQYRNRYAQQQMEQQLNCCDRGLHLTDADRQQIRDQNDAMVQQMRGQEHASFTGLIESAMSEAQVAMARQMSQIYWGTGTIGMQIRTRTPVKLTLWQRARWLVSRCRYQLSRPLQWVADSVRGYELRVSEDD